MSERSFWRNAFGLACAAAAVAFFVNVWSVVVPFLIGLATSYLFYPLVDRFVGLGLRQDRVVLVLYGVLLGSGAILTFFFLPNLIHQAQVVGRELPSYAQTIDTAVGGLNGFIHSTMERLFGDRARAFVIPFNAEKFIDQVFATVPQNLHNVAHWSLWILIIPFVSFFGLSHGKRWIDGVFQITPSEFVESLLGLMAEINAALGSYLRGLVIESLCVGVATMIGLWALGIEGFVFLGVVTGLLNIVPFLAPIVGGSLALLAGIFQGASSTMLIGIVFLFVGVRLLDDFVLIPFVIGHSVKLHPILMLFSILAGFQLAGVLGLLIAIPAAAVLKVVLTILLRSRNERLVMRLNHVHI